MVDTTRLYHMRLPDTNRGTHQGEIHLRDRVVSSAAGDDRVSRAPRRGPNIFKKNVLSDNFRSFLNGLEWVSNCQYYTVFLIIRYSCLI
jgi:hypothetical protein